MSWWNTSNFSDLASKALKNAQKKIDKALDIEDSTEKADTEAQVSSVKKESGDKGEFWSSWLGESSGGSDEQTKSTGSAWSLPWGSGTDQKAEASSELVAQKTAEEIKNEVLKAAKERTKAKSKLFPQKSKKDTDIKTQEAVKSVEVTHKEEAGINQETASLTSAESNPDDSKKVHIIQPGTDEKIQETDSGRADDTGTIGKSDTTYKDDLEHSEFQEMQNAEQSGSCFKEISENDADLNLVSEIPHAELDIKSANETGSVNLEAISQTEPETFETTNEAQLQKQFTDSTVQKNIEDSDENPIPDEFNTSVHFDKPSSYSDPSGTDISDSVEFVTEKDIEFSEPVSVVTADSCDNVSSDPEMVDICDKIEITGKEEGTVEDSSQVVDESEVRQSSMEDVTNPDAVNVSMDIPLDNFELTSDADSLYPKSADLSYSAPEVLIRDQLDTEKVAHIVSSDSESSMSKLDISMDTCTSEETLVEVSIPQEQEQYDQQTHVVLQSEFQEGLNVEVHYLDHPEDSNKGLTAHDLLQISNNDNIDVEVDTYQEGSSSNEDRGELSPANSFVKCMLEDVIDDSKLDDNSDSHSATEKSEGSRSVYSNHESSDEIDTTTSSDIEIISMPTPNGENRQISPVDPIPLRIALQKSSWPSPTHRRTDSSDSSNTSKDGGYADLSPGRDTYEYSDNGARALIEPVESQRLGSELPALSEEDDPLHPQKLLKESDYEESHDIGSHDQMSHDQQTNPEQKLAEVSQILQAREDKLLQLSKDNCDLTETNNILKNQLKQTEEAREAEMTDINELTAEFTQRLTDSEKRIASTIKEKEALKKQLQDAQSEIAKRSGDTSLKDILVEKEEQIAELLTEGEKLSKSQLQSNTIIKKLRQKEKDNDNTITTQKKKLDTQKEELDHLHLVLESKEELEKKQTEAITQLSAAVKKQEQELVKVKSDYEEASEKMRGLQAALDNSYKEMAELHRNNAAQGSKAQEIALSAEMQVREELKLQIEKQLQQHRWEKESLGMQIEDLQMTMSRMEKDHSRREDLLRQEISDLHKQLQEDEARTQELTQGVSLATRPLLRQIENLQSTFNMQSSTWEKVEKNLSDRLSEVQNQLAIVTEKERNANDQMMDLSSKVSLLEAQNSRLRQEKSQMTAQLEMLKSKVEMFEDAKQHEAAQLEVMKQQMQQELSDLKKEKVLLETQLDVERSKMEQEKKKSAMLQEQIRDLERDLQRSRSQGTPVRTTPSPVSVSRQNSMVGSLHDQSFQSITQEEIDRSFYLSSPNGNKQSLYEALRQSGAANLLENLQSQLKLRDGEITHLQDEIRSLERTRESMAKELVNLSNMNDDLEGKLKDLPVLQNLHQELDQRYNALLQMYGEKVEEVNELRLDLADVKEMYKAQITHLLGQS